MEQFALEFFVTRNVPVDKLLITEGRLKILELDELGEIKHKLTPHSRFALEAAGLVAAEVAASAPAGDRA